MVSERLKILVFETDTPHPDTIKQHGTFGQIVHKLFQSAAQSQNLPIQVLTTSILITNDPKTVPSPSSIPDDTNAIFITEGIGDAFSNDPWILSLVSCIQDLWTNRPNILFAGVCLGHQILARALEAGVRTATSGKKELGITTIQLNSVGRRLFLTSTLDIQQMHQDHVLLETLPGGVYSWGETKHTSVQGMYAPRKVFTCQGHLFMDEGMVRREIAARRENGAIVASDEEDVVWAEKTAGQPHDGKVVAEAMLRFFLGEDEEGRSTGC